MVHNKGIYRAHANLQDILAHTKRNEKTNCLEWQLSKDEGYAKWRVNQKKITVSRLVCELIYGKPEDGWLALHSCDNPPCLNPDHLRWGTMADNNQDKIDRARLKGERHPRAKYTNAQILEVKKMIASGASTIEVCEQFGMSKETYFGIKSGRDWQNVRLDQ